MVEILLRQEARARRAANAWSAWPELSPPWPPRSPPARSSLTSLAWRRKSGERAHQGVVEAGPGCQEEEGLGWPATLAEIDISLKLKEDVETRSDRHE